MFHHWGTICTASSECPSWTVTTWESPAISTWFRALGRAPATLGNWYPLCKLPSKMHQTLQTHPICSVASPSDDCCLGKKHMQGCKMENKDFWKTEWSYASQYSGEMLPGKPLSKAHMVPLGDSSNIFCEVCLRAPTWPCQTTPFTEPECDHVTFTGSISIVTTLPPQASTCSAMRVDLRRLLWAGAEDKVTLLKL